MATLWQKNSQAHEQVSAFTVGKDREFDMLLAEADVLGNIAHTTMLESIGLLTREEMNLVHAELRNMYADIEAGKFIIEDDVEDVHSQVELLLTRKLGDVGKKIHSGRSRNDQVLVDLKIFMRDAIKETVSSVQQLFTTLQSLSEKHADVLIPGYTHLQVAMPSSFGLWFGCYAESLSDDLQLLLATYKITNQNPLGSAAGYGSSFPLNRTMTTDLLGFEELNYNVMYAQMGRGKVEKTVSYAIASIGSTLSKMAMEVCMFMSQNFGFVTFPDEFTTGSSIMPHKKNPDVFELIRGKCNKLQALPAEIAYITTNLPFGYNRDLQLIKEHFLPAFDEIISCMEIANLLFSHIQISDTILDDSKYDYLFSVDEVNRRVLEGMPFRDAYKQVGLEIQEGKFNPDKSANHTHEGSIGNLCTEEIRRKFNTIFDEFNFDVLTEKKRQLLQVTS